MTAACSRDKPSEQPADAAQEDVADPGSIGGTSWRLVQIMSMDDGSIIEFEPVAPTSP